MKQTEDQVDKCKHHQLNVVGQDGKKRTNQIVQTKKNYFQMDGKTVQSLPMTEIGKLM